MSGQVKVVRIYLSEIDKVNHHNLMHEIVRRLQDEHKVHGVTVFRGIVGFGGQGQVHAADLLRLRADLPLVVEFFDEPETVEEALQWISKLVRPRHIIVWDAEGR
ncbi:MAG: DUF190 domain-containing protein [Nitrococcus mobilis]|nr:DUF190 domain-containing protein [Nitrococcus mobilis]